MFTKKGVLIGLLVALAPVSGHAQVFAGPEFRLNAYTTGVQQFPSLTMTPAGDFSVVWSGETPSGDGEGVIARRFDARGNGLGSDFQVNTYTEWNQGWHSSDAAVDRAGNLVVVWPTDRMDGSYMDVLAQRHDASGAPLGAEFRVNSYTTGSQGDQNPGSVSVARAPDGRFVVVWQGTPGPVTGNDIFGQRYDAAGNPVGAEFRANTYTTDAQTRPDVAMDGVGNFVVVWSSFGQDGDRGGVFAQRFDSAGGPAGIEFQVNTTTAGDQSGDQYWGPSVARAPGGEFVVVWDDLAQNDVFAQRYDASGGGAGAEFRVNSNTLALQTHSAAAMDHLGNFVVAFASGQYFFATQVMGRRFTANGTPRGMEFQMDTSVAGFPYRFPTVGSDDVGNFLMAWGTVNTDPGDPNHSIRAQRFGGLRPEALRVDVTGNGVLEPGETVDARPVWRNQNGAAQTFGGGLAAISGPPGGTYTITDGAGAYGAVADGTSAECTDCYGVAVAGTRPAVHWDASAIETITPDAQGQQKRWLLHIGESFTDVPVANPFYRFIEALLHHLITGGCSGAQYCPQSVTTREQMAVFVLVAREGTGSVPAACGATAMFADVPASNPFCRWVEELARRAVVSGCGGGNYCPTASVTREQMPIFVLRTLDSSLSPPACGTPVFSDVPASSAFCRWIEELARRSVVTGCGGGRYCPTDSVTREQMGVFIAVTFGLTLYGP